jgi:hypothetical protein
MLAVEQGSGQIWLYDEFLCHIEYDISEALSFIDGHQVQRIFLRLLEEGCAPLLDAYDLTLVIADGSRCAIPRPLQRMGLARIECYVESRPSS